jgi:aspartate/methionine/tyrosine aminotransferase
LRAQLPDFPWDALVPFGDKARAHPNGIIDLSQGTPVDPTPEFIQKAIREASNSPGYPLLQEPMSYELQLKTGQLSV